MPDTRRPLESYSHETLIAWIRIRDFSYFQEELDAVERRLLSQEYRPPRFVLVRGEELIR